MRAVEGADPEMDDAHGLRAVVLRTGQIGLHLCETLRRKPHSL